VRFSVLFAAVLLTGCAIIAVEDVRVQSVAGEDCELGVKFSRDASGDESGTLSKGQGQVAGDGEQGAGSDSAIMARCRSKQ